jgi:CRP-like cAMP-binding protein
MFSSSRTPLRRAGAEVIVTRFKTLARLTPAEEALVAGLSDWRWDPPGLELVHEAGRLTPRVLVSGWAARIRDLPDGRRQIIALILPGDAIGLCRRPQPLALCPVMALTAIQTLDALPLVRAIADQATHPNLCAAVDIAAALDEAWLMDQVVRLGRLTAFERIAHLQLEILTRLSSVGLASERQTPFPLTQEMLADVTGLSLVHVNRTLQQLRREKLIELSQGRLKILDVEAMRDLCDFQEAKPHAWSQSLQSR